MGASLKDYGERQHESCRYGKLTKAFIVPMDGSAETPTVMPLCMWKIDEPAPPAIIRSWGGAVDVERDCAVCVAHQRIVVTGTGEAA